MRTNFRTTLISTILRWMMIPILLVEIFGFAASPAYAVNTVIYVKANASGAKDGTSWADAYTDLQLAIFAAESSNQIWVAAGTYYPTYPTTGADRTVSFTLKNGVSIYGGFDGTETLLSERDPATNITILSGDIGTPGSISDNSYHVVNGGGTDNSAMLDGFTITKGNANLVVTGSQEQYGAGMYNVNSSPTLSNLIFTENTTPRYGAGMFNSASSPKLNNILFVNNTAQRAGGVYNTNFSNPVLTNVIFRNNTASVRGGGMTTAESSAPELTNVTFSGNTAPVGAALHNVGSYPILKNVTISGNTASIDGGGLYNESSTPTLTNVTISNNSAAGSGGIYNDNSDPVITNSIIYGNTGEEIYDLNSTPDLTNSIVKGGCPSGANCTNVLDQDPLLGLLANNGGYTQTMAPGVGSPAIDTGTDAGCLPEDQRGYSRPQGAHCDIGAVEVDNQAPDTALDSFPPDPDSDNTPTFTFSGDDPGGSGVTSFQCRMDGGSYIPCNSPFTSSPLLPGSHTFDVYTVDQASNADPTPASYTWSLEFTPTLVTSIVRANASPTSIASVNFTVTFSANVTGVDSGDFMLTTSGVSGAAITGVSGSNSTYTVSVNTGANNGTIRLDIPDLADIDDPIGNSPANLPYTSGGTYTINKTGTFLDVPNIHWAWRYVEGLYYSGVTGGCGNSNYCPGTPVTRDQMAVFLLKGKHGSGYTPPAVGDTTGFSDVPTNHWAAAWIKQLAAEGITGGCGGGKYCPGTAVTRDQMAIFLLKVKHDTSYSPPPPSGVFLDVPITHWAAAWIEQLAAEGITGGCGSGIYCPSSPVTRDQMAIFLLKTFNLPPLP